MRNMIVAALIAAVSSTSMSAPAMAQSRADDARLDAAQTRFDREYRLYQDEIRRYRSLRGGYYGGAVQDPRGYDAPPRRYYADERDEGDYDPAQYYRDGPSYRQRTLAADDRVYRGSDGQYYCKRSDGTTGLIIGAAGGGILGNVIDGGRSRTVGTLIGGAIGALAGRAVEQQNSIQCR